MNLKTLYVIQSLWHGNTSQPPSQTHTHTMQTMESIENGRNRSDSSNTNGQQKPFK